MRGRSLFSVFSGGVALATAVLLACGGTDGGSLVADASSADATATDSAVDSAATDAADGSSDAGTDTGTDARLSADCPPTPPTPDAGCAKLELECEYGTSAFRSCNVVAKCTGTWALSGPTDACNAGLDAGGACPATFGEIVAGSPCATFRQVCEYSQGVCGCGFNHIADVWFCDSPSTAGCPSPRPKLGSTCTSNGLTCDYASCSVLGGPRMQCTGGVWYEVAVACPP
jgi:hypothetical protein